jgi:L,D-transpeptidase YcbB
MDNGVRRILAGVAAGTLSLLTSASIVASPSMAQEGANPRVEAPSPYSWSRTAVAELQQELGIVSQEGLDPANYDGADLDQVLKTKGESAETDAAATRVALAIARDYAHGRVDEHARIDWHIATVTPDMERLSAGLTQALRTNSLRPWLRSLLPTDLRYAALRTALVATPVSDVAMRDRLRINLERWRWMPRSLGSEHIYVNVPSYSLNVVDHGKLVSTYTVVVGKPSTPTPLINAEARSIVVNPWWNVPPSIQRHMKGGKGFVVKAGGGFAQPPGPRNALGKVKIDMPNQFNIYLHDTPSKSLFAAASRAYSHGCIRVKDVDRLAAELAALDKGSDAPVKKALAGSETRTLPLQHGRPVYLVYFTADVGPDGKVVTLEDPYGRDSQLIASLDATPKLALNDQAKTRRS